MITYPFTWLEISKEAFDNNIAMYKRVIGDKRQLAPVIKSNGYGHGIKEIAKLCQENALVDWVCIASIEEAVQLRSWGFNKKILLISFIGNELKKALENDVEVVVSCWEEVEHLNNQLAMLFAFESFDKLRTNGESNLVKKAYAISNSHSMDRKTKDLPDHNNNFSVPFVLSLSKDSNDKKKKLRIHLKIDTGLSRFGIPPAHALEIIKKINKLSRVKLTGICTHFSQSSNVDTSYTMYQYEQFNNLLDLLENEQCLPSLIHASNSAGTTLLDFGRCNFFRVGAGIYGIWPTSANKEITEQKYPWFKLIPILSWKAYIMRIKEVPANTPIGYEKSYTTTRATRIGMIPVGYFDGYDFRLSNGGFGFVKGAKVPVIGRIAMNVTLFDITDNSCTIGDVIEIMGSMPGITPYDIAKIMNNPNIREFLATLNPGLVKRIVT